MMDKSFNQSIHRLSNVNLHHLYLDV